MDVRYLILILLLFSSCMPSPTVTDSNLSNSTNTSGGSNGGTSTPPPGTLNWNYLGQVTTSITINVSNYNNAYLVGAPLENYLGKISNLSSTDFCLISSYSIGGFTHELRTRVVPISYYDFTAKRRINSLRVDFPDFTNGTSYCNKSSRILDSSGLYVDDSSTPSSSTRIHFDPSKICPQCSNMLIASRTRLFKVEALSLDEVPKTSVDTTKLALQVDSNFAVLGSAGTCSNTECRTRGFDCCLENQCVRDGTLRAQATSGSYSSLLLTAEKERLTNPMSYLNYPQLYYICGTAVPTEATESTTGISSEDQTEAFEQLKKDHLCIQHLKSQSTANPFHIELLTTQFTATQDCLTSVSQEKETFYYKNVMQRLYKTCGCWKNELSEMVTSCPAYEYVVTQKDSLGQPTKIDCFTPPTQPAVPLQQEVSVSSRSAPHRFFDKNGVERALTEGVEQEGDSFEYVDEGKVLPVQQNFSMNAILGQMSVTLDKALPAKSVNVELDQVYIISTQSGYYTPCTTCGKDSWLGSFSAHPSSSMGTGLQAIGHTTERDAFFTNTTAGNYEDTIFGRACWLPPTMLPYSHSANTTLQTQRLNRLRAQATLYVNGYQRDWYGFNKGALIGSFDGVTWFAIGKGRIVRSSSKKLYLAINAPFADLAASTMNVVRISAFDGITQAAQVDYDPKYHQSHPYQNEAGNCQKYHLCSSDADCVTQLGWEYACADVKDLKTNWPEFDSNGNEKASSSKTVTLDQILQQKRFPSATTKRCIYRGAGSLCHVNSSTLLTKDLNTTKLLTCGPNFYCSSLSSGTHNTQISRFGSKLEDIPASRNHFFGKDANVLGRPLHYIASGSIDSDVRMIISSNASTFEATLSANTGLCQPGKALPTSTTATGPFNQHRSADSMKRTDYISQIGSCNSTLFSVNRHLSCPVLNSEGNFEIFAATTLAADFNKRASSQNSCGLESLLKTANLTSNADTLLTFSPFRSIEGKTLESQVVVDPTFARDACFRRAGSVCHTDYDCSPNKMHGSLVDLFQKDFFGNDAEKSYWSEYLVCGQRYPKPLPSNVDEFKNYDMTKNKCCREVGKDLTTFTRDIPQDTFVSTAKQYLEVSANLKMNLHPGIAPNDPLRYSRLSTVEGIGSSSRPILTANINRVGNVLNSTGLISGSPSSNSLTQSPNITTPLQWKTLTEANSETCCGGGWIRKFSDGSTDWTKNRLVLDVNNFKCINSRTPLITNPEDVSPQYLSSGTATRLASQDYGDYCRDKTNSNGACAQYSIQNLVTDSGPSATTSYGTTTINTISPIYSSSENPDFYFMPRSADGNQNVIIDASLDYTKDKNARTNIAIKLPSYVPTEFDSELNTSPSNKIFLVTPNNSIARRACASAATLPDNFTFNAAPVSSGASEECYFNLSSSRILRVWMNQAAWTFYKDRQLGVEFEFLTAGQGLQRRQPGTSAYYLKRLARLELSGIPQISFEMLTCSDNAARVVPGIFKTGINFQSDFTRASFSFAANGNFQTTHHGLQHDPVFSANDFKCCAPLGTTYVDNKIGDATFERCCSGGGIVSGNVKTCALPPGTDLHVYFNRFVSNEGIGSDKPGGGLVDADFDSQTGEPALSSSVSDKIRALGQAYCTSGKVRQGGAFGNYVIEPQGNLTNLTDRIYNIIDSIQDVGENSNSASTVVTGYPAFSNGFRWNHHLYCDD